MSNKYTNGKIYSLRSPNLEKYYIGSTTQPLHKRFHEHKKHYDSFCEERRNGISSFEVIKAGDCYIELIEEFPCKNRMELRKREGEIQRQHKDEIVNKREEGRTKKQWAKDNQKHVKDKRKQDYWKNQKENIAKSRKWVTDNQERVKANQESWYQSNKAKIKFLLKKNFLSKMKQKVKCICGSQVSISNHRRHKSSRNHLEFISIYEHFKVSDPLLYNAITQHIELIFRKHGISI